MANNTRRVNPILYALPIVVLIAGFFVFTAARRSIDRAAVTSEIDRLRASGQPVSVADTLPQIPRAENAFYVYAEASAKLPAVPDTVKAATKRLIYAPIAKWRPEDIQRIRTHIRENAAAIELTRKASRMRRYAPDMNGKTITNPDRRPVRNLIVLANELLRTARVAIAEGRTDDAIGLCDDAMGVAQHASATNTLVGRIVGIAIQNIVLDLMSQMLAQAQQTTDLDRIAHFMDHLPHGPSTKRGIACERAIEISFIDDLRAGKRTISDITGGAVTPQGRLDRRIIDRNELSVLRHTEEYMACADKPFYTVHTTLDRIERDLKPGPDMMIEAVILPTYSAYIAQEAGARTRVQVLKTAAAIKLYKARHGSYPKSLADLGKTPIDEFTGKPLIYKTTNGFVVYSVGQNLKDDGGAVGKDRRTGDIVYRE